MFRVLTTANLLLPTPYRLTLGRLFSWFLGWKEGGTAVRVDRRNSWKTAGQRWSISTKRRPRAKRVKGDKRTAGGEIKPRNALFGALVAVRALACVTPKTFARPSLPSEETEAPWGSILSAPRCKGFCWGDLSEVPWTPHNVLRVVLIPGLPGSLRQDNFLIGPRGQEVGPHSRATAVTSLGDRIF